MQSTGYTVLGWVVWRIALRLARRKLARNRVRLGAAAVAGLALAAGIAAARGSPEE